jgi:hypothetical protein
MRNALSLSLAIVGASLLFSASCRADEDGFFCTARGYLAYNLRGGITPGVTGHVLKVVRFDSKRGVYLAGQVMLQDFQVHRMICTQDRIDVSGYANVFKQYAITIAGPAGPQIVGFSEDPRRRFNPQKDGPEPRCFCAGQPGVEKIRLEGDDSSHGYQLVLTHTTKSWQGAIQHRNRAEIIITAPSGGRPQRLVLYDERSLETID